MPASETAILSTEISALKEDMREARGDVRKLSDNLADVSTKLAVLNDRLERGAPPVPQQQAAAAVGIGGGLAGVGAAIWQMFEAWVTRGGGGAHP